MQDDTQPTQTIRPDTQPTQAQRRTSRTRRAEGPQAVRRRPSRRQVLAGLGLLGGGLAAGACGGMALMNLLAPSEGAGQSSGSVVVLPNEAPPVVAREDWGALPPNHNALNESGFYSPDNLNGWRVYDQPLPDVYQTLVLHHSVVYEDDDFATLLLIQDLHRNDRRWADVGYHYFVGRDGTLFAGRDLGVRGTHVGGFNTGSVGICLLGNFMVIEPTEAQIRSARWLVNVLADALALTHLAAHRSFNPETQCPGDNLVTYLAPFAAGAGLSLGIDGYQTPTPAPDASAAACPCCDCGIV